MCVCVCVPKWATTLPNMRSLPYIPFNSAPKGNHVQQHTHIWIECCSYCGWTNLHRNRIIPGLLGWCRISSTHIWIVVVSYYCLLTQFQKGRPLSPNYTFKARMQPPMDSSPLYCLETQPQNEHPQKANTLDQCFWKNKRHPSKWNETHLIYV